MHGFRSNAYGLPVVLRTQTSVRMQRQMMTLNPDCVFLWNEARTTNSSIHVDVRPGEDYSSRLCGHPMQEIWMQYSLPIYEGYTESDIVKHKTTRQQHPATAFDRYVRIDIKQENGFRAHPGVVSNESIQRER
jgi:hypothetical protein